MMMMMMFFVYQKWPPSYLEVEKIVLGGIHYVANLLKNEKKKR